MDDYTIYVVDTETTGFDPINNDVIEVSMLRLSRQDDGFKREQKTWFLKPASELHISDEALKVNGHKKEDILWKTQEGKEKYKTVQEVLPEIELWIMEDCSSVMDRIFAGHNPNFDIQFLKSTWAKGGSESTFPFDLTAGNRVLDTKQLVLFIDLCVGKRRTKYSLGEVIKPFGVKKGKAHRADEDTRMTTDLLETILTSVAPHVKSIYNESY
jgi:DNA polymerase III alpha subunit (gram-positive type)